MVSTSKAPPGPATSGAFAKVVTAGSYMTRARGRGNSLKRWSFRLLILIAALVVLWLLFGVVVRIATTQMWFDSVDHGAAYRTMLEAKILLFCIFGAIAAVLSGLTIISLRRIRSPLPLSPDDDTLRWVFRKYEPRISRLIVLLAVIVPAILVGQRAAAGWQTYLLWRHVTPWHVSDPLFHKDVSFFVEVYPFHVMVVSLLTQALTCALWIAVVGGYWYGVWRLRRGRRKVTSEFTRLISLLLAGYLALKAVNYWLSRYALTTSPRGGITGASYTDVHAALPAKYVLMSIAILCAVALLANAVLAERVHTFGRVRTLAGAVVLMLVAVGVVGNAWPALEYHFREAPSAAKLDLDEILHNQQATRAAYGLDGNVRTVSYSPSNTMSPAQLVHLAGQTAQTPLIDPNQLSPTFNVQQQIQAYYGFKSTLDIGNYNINGRQQDVALAVRELTTNAIPHPSWVNNHLVYTHGYGIVAAPTTRLDPKTESPLYLDGGMPPSQQIPVTRPQVYFGPAFGSSSYSIVGQPAGSRTKVEFDHPGGNGSSSSNHSTYDADGGIPIGSTLRRLLFAYQLRDPNILFSSELNSASQLLTLRDPRARIAKLAPWLTLDGDIYPAVVDGHIDWIADGYTTSANYPDSQLVNLHAATATTLTAHGASVAQPNRQVNYLQNSVKAVVDAYTGKVHLYEWNQQQDPDPLLKSWESVFPGTVQPQSSIPPDLLRQLRYPTDLFNVQRYLLAKYHVTQPANFYSGNDFWTVPADISAPGSSTPPLPSKYMSMSLDGSGAQQYSLSSPMVTLNGRQLTAFIYVDSQPGPNYGKITVLNFSSGSQSESPAQVQNDIESDTEITNELTLQRGGNSNVALGDLDTVPVAGRMLYVEPVYTRSKGSASFPILRHVIALYGNGDPSFDNTLGQAVRDAIQSGAASG